jgi:hypothetical protein
MLKLIVNVITTILYPLYNVNGFPKWNTYDMAILVFLESFFGIDIIMKFFLQELDE